jgi:hypothetical protein
MGELYFHMGMLISRVISVGRRINFVVSMQLGVMKMKRNKAAVTVRCASHA